jgi:serine/threonine-protein kinase
MRICPACSRRYADNFGQCSEDGAPLVLDRTPAILAPGTQLDGGFMIAQLVGGGPTGEVYAAEYQRQLVAVKVLSQDLVGDPVFAKQLVRLLGHLSKVRHPGVASVLVASELSPRQPVIVRELVNGRSLSDLILHTGPLPVERALPLAMKAAEALTEAHRAGALHLALKPSNIFVSDVDDVKLVDFGIGQRTPLPGGRVVHGDPRFLAPEQFDGKLVSFRSDIYGLGAILYYLLTGRPLYPALGPDAERVVATQRPPPPSSVAKHLAGQIKLDQVVLRALEKVPAKRYLSVQHFGRMMDGVLQELTGHAPAIQLAAGDPTGGRTLPMGVQAFAPPPMVQYASGPPTVETGAPSYAEDTLRMPVGADGFDGAGLDGPTIRERHPRAMPGAETHGAPTIPVPMAQPPQAPPYVAASHDTIRAVVAPVPMRPVGAQPIAPRGPIGGQGVQVAPPPVPGGPGGYDDVGIEVVEEELFPQPRKKKKKKKPAAPPVIAVRAEAALNLGHQAGGFRRTDPGQAVLLDQQFLDEARGPERNLATMEIRVRPADLPPLDTGDSDAASSPAAPPARKSRRVGRWVFTGLALVLLFVLAAAGAAALASWLSARGRQPLPPQPPPAATSTP